ncbi:hypothetical protein [Undibacterium danionis]|uniref:Flagellar FliJ protein n=1 Tax=Undibacterium danionis TaxID=1812100 RepID=A0ABV6I8N3_9BURK
MTAIQQPNAASVDAQKTISAILQKRRDNFGAELKQSSAQGQQKLGDLQRVKASNQRELSSTEAEFNDAKIATVREQAALQRSAAAGENDWLENETRREFVVTAAQEGIVTAMTAE